MFIRRNRVSGPENGSCEGAPGVDGGRSGQTSHLVKRCVDFLERVRPGVRGVVKAGRVGVRAWL